MIRKVLVANRGEIARRVFRTCRAMGIATVAVYSDPDATEPHVIEADEAVHLPGSSATDTYLRGDLIVHAAVEAGADAVHPGYGFLSENAGFAAEVIGTDLTWIGPPVRAIEIMGSKLASKKLMEESGVPTLPGVDLTGIGANGVTDAAERIGYPVLVKASAGGGGKGMRVVHEADDLLEEIEAARRESAAAFGDDTVFLEKYLESPRHIEIQIFADTLGRVEALFERECSIQRRHQKVIEEAPSVVVDENLRERMSQAAIEAARAVDYVGAGTVEFLYDRGAFYFLEMNTRLQVEHPVTEMITGLDLVRLQIEIADGKPLVASPTMTGHAIEARLYAEDPLHEFVPASGRLDLFEIGGESRIRVDSGVETGSNVSVFYDPMLAKIVAHGSTRREAATLLAGALRTARIHGPITNRPLLTRILEDDGFLKGDINTHFLDERDLGTLAAPLADPGLELVAAVAAALSDQVLERRRTPVLRSIPSGWRNSPQHHQERSFTGVHGLHTVGYTASPNGYAVTSEPGLVVRHCDAERVEIESGDESHQFEVARYGPVRNLDSARGPVRLIEVPRFPVAEASEDPGSLHAPMPGKVLRVLIGVGEHVEKNQTLLVLEAMKMEHTIRSPSNGMVTRIDHGEGDQVEAGTVLVVVEAVEVPST
jgi:acyl-CoA carboxylase subunit alpha